MFGEVALDIDMEQFDEVFDARKHKIKAKLDTDLTADDLKAIIAEYKKIVKKETKTRLPAGCRASSSACPATPCSGPGGTPKATYYRKMEKIPDETRHRRQRAGDGVRQHGRHLLHRRRLHPRSRLRGEKVFYGEFLVNAQGEDVVAGIRTPQPISELEELECPTSTSSSARSPRASKSTTRTCRISSSPCRKARCTCCRPATASARVRPRCASRWRWWKRGLIDEKTAVLRVAPTQLDQLLHPVFDPASR